MLSPLEKEQVTPLEDFFIMNSKIPADIEEYVKNPEEYRLSIRGAVGNPTELSYRDLLTKFEMKHIVTELFCMPELTGVGQFSGPSLYDVISYVQPKDDSAKAVFVAADGYVREISISDIREHQEDYLLAVAMNGYPLSIEHGYPVRLALAGRAGSLWVQWIVKITIVSEDATLKISLNVIYSDFTQGTACFLPERMRSLIQTASYPLPTLQDLLW